jgi:hypothetical protein
MNRTFKPGFWNSAPGPWLSLLVPAVVLALIIVWAYAGRCEVLLIPQDYSCGMTEYWLKQETPPIKGQVQSGTLDTETQMLTVDLLVAPGKVETVVLKIVSKGINPRKKNIGGY